MTDWQWYKITIVLGICIALMWFIKRTLSLVAAGRKAQSDARRSRMSSIKGQQREKQAGKELQSMGFKILEEQPETQVGWWIDGVWTETKITGDYLVKRDGELGLVEVKSGKAARATHRNTRRQLLEYQHAFDVDAVFLYDTERSSLNRIVFESNDSQANSAKNTILWLLFASFLGFFVGYYLSH